MKMEEAEKAFIEALDKSMGNLYARGDWYKRKTVRMAFRKGWQRAMEQVNNCDAPAVSKSVCTFPIPCNHDWNSEFCKTRCNFRKEQTVC